MTVSIQGILGISQVLARAFRWMINNLTSHRRYDEKKLQENLDAEIFGVLIEEAREGFDEGIVVELISEEDGDVETNCGRISSWIENWKNDQENNSA